MVEIERKFLVGSDVFKKDAFQKFHIKQGYLNSDKSRTVRVRISNDDGFLTIKGKSGATGLTRFEWEQPILKDDAENLLELCEEGVIDKIRYLVKFKDQIFEVDEFFGDNEGLFLAEIELNSEEDVVKLPNWLGEEVTGNLKYYNSQLSKHPYINWKR